MIVIRVTRVIGMDIKKIKANKVEEMYPKGLENYGAGFDGVPERPLMFAYR